MEIKFDVYFKKNLGTLFKNNEVDLNGLPARTNLQLVLVDRLEINYKIGSNKYTDIVTITDATENLIQIPFKSDVVKKGLNEFEIVAYMKNGDIKVSQTYTYNIDEGIGEGKQTGAGGSSDGHTHNNLNVLNSITQTKVNEWNNKADATHSHSEYAGKSHTHNASEIEGLENVDIDLSDYYTKSETDEAMNDKANKVHTHNEYLTELPTHTHSEYLKELPTHEHEQYLTEHQDISHKADKENTYTKAQTDNKISEEIAKAQLGGSGEVDLSDYATKDFVNNKVGDISSRIINEDEIFIPFTLSNTKNAPDKLPIKTHESGGDQPIHPKVLYFKDGFGGYKFWMAYTPYPNGNDGEENPCIACSNDMINWITPNGVQNPIDAGTSVNYMSDTHLVYNNNTKELEIWYRQVLNGERIYRRTSTDGVVWNEREQIQYFNNGSIVNALSPTVIFEDGKYKIWVATGNPNGIVKYYESLDGYDWEFITSTNLIAWHLDIIKTDIGYEAIISDSQPGSSISYSKSVDGVTWTDKEQLLTSPVGDKWDSSRLYRASFIKNNGTYYVYYTGVYNNNWGIGLSVSTIKNDIQSIKGCCHDVPGNVNLNTFELLKMIETLSNKIDIIQGGGNSDIVPPAGDYVTKGLVCHYDMSTGRKGDSMLVDVSGNGHNLTLNKQPSNGGFTGKSFNIVDEAVVFQKDDIGARFSVGTIECYLKPTSTDGSDFKKRVFGIGGDNGKGFYCWIGGSTICIYRDDLKVVEETSTYNLVPDVAVHIVVSFSNNSIKLYIDSVLIKEYNASFTNSFNFGRLNVGNNGSTSSISQELYSCRLYDVVLSEDDIKNNYNYEKSKNIG
jgi:hypothetical protein